MRLLLIEDDQLLGAGIQAGLRQEGYAVNWVTNGEAALGTLGLETYDIAVLDIGLPKISGLEVLRQMRARGDATPVLLLTARDTTQDKVAGLDSGADDYLIKPFDLDELSARLRALLRRHGGRATPAIRHRNLVLDPIAHTCAVDGGLVEISPREFNVLQMLLENRGKVLSRARLEEGLYSWGHEVESNTIEVHVHHLRRKLGADFIRTVRGVGYIIDNE